MKCGHAKMPVPFRRGTCQKKSGRAKMTQHQNVADFMWARRPRALALR